MKCTNSKVGRLLFLYEFGMLSDLDRKKFETHLLDCDYCFQNLHALNPAMEKMRKEKQSFISALQPKHKKSWLKELKSPLNHLFPQPIWDWSTILKPAAGLAIVVLLTIFIINEQTDDYVQYSSLAQIEPIPYIPLHQKGDYDLTVSDELFDVAMLLYSNFRYKEAAIKLDSARVLDPQNLNIQFYLGLNYLLADMPDSAIIYLNHVCKSEENPFSEKSYWYLGNAYLLKEDGEKAIAEFEKVMENKDLYARKAKEIIGKIKEIIK